MNELIKDHLLISLIAFITPVVIAAWKLMVVLYVKPRDFRISILEKNLDEIRKEVQSTQKQPEEKPTISDASFSEIKEEKTESEPIKFHPTDELLTSIDKLYSKWRDEELTELQRDQFEKELIGKKVRWDATMKSIGEESDGYYWTSLGSIEKNWGVHVIAVFESKYREVLLLVRKDQKVTVTGTIDSFSLAPLLKGCKIVKS